MEVSPDVLRELANGAEVMGVELGNALLDADELLADPKFCDGPLHDALVAACGELARVAAALQVILIAEDTEGLVPRSRDCSREASA